MAKILIVDDETGIRELLSEILRDERHDVALAENATAARAALSNFRPDLVLLDIWMPDTDGITLLKEWGVSGQLTMPVVMMSGHATIETAVEATRLGAVDCLEKPIGMQKLLATVKKALEAGPRAVRNTPSLNDLTRSATLREIKRRLDALLARSPVLLLRSRPGGIAEVVAHTARVTGRTWLDLAQESQPLGLESLQRAAGAVLWCEELAHLSRLQQKNLVFAFERLETHKQHLLVATTHSQAELASQGWDEGVLTRLFDTTLSVPTLADIPDEVPDLASHLLDHLADSGACELRRFSTAALNLLRQHNWPGGYAELKGAVRSLALASAEELIEDKAVMDFLAPVAQEDKGIPGLPPGTVDLPLREAREIFERMYFDYHLKRDGGNMTRLAERSGLERTHLYRKLKDLGLR
ncbi:MAG: sigma-54-dependent Fis family transcriptional regulator [Rhodocyclaceae bacterium]|jgi:two-component system nitrogen regulation response regulator NtrX|nr:sigma-54-dependent Fis family transcriptional regulator [Rhodocyclaceae bacterium]MBK6908934.1 sigma-54-dependent Fis family transcriptional regulator [Rhodocyclaceae bacterium]